MKNIALFLITLYCCTQISSSEDHKNVVTEFIDQKYYIEEEINKEINNNCPLLSTAWGHYECNCIENASPYLKILRKIKTLVEDYQWQNALEQLSQLSKEFPDKQTEIKNLKDKLKPITTYLCNTLSDVIEQSGNNIQLFPLELSGIIISYLQPLKKECYSKHIKECILFSPDRTKYLILLDGIIKTFNCISNRREATFLAKHYQKINDIGWSNDNSKLAFKDDNTVNIHDLEKEKVLYSFSADSGMSINEIIWSNDSSKIAIIAFDGIIRIWSIYSGKKLAGLEAKKPILTVFWAPDDNKLACMPYTDNEKVIVFDINTKNYTLIPRHTCKSIGWLPDSKRIATDECNSIIIWDASSAKKVNHIQLDNLTKFPEIELIVGAKNSSKIIVTRIHKSLPQNKIFYLEIEDDTALKFVTGTHSTLFTVLSESKYRALKDYIDKVRPQLTYYDLSYLLTEIFKEWDPRIKILYLNDIINVEGTTLG